MNNGESKIIILLNKSSDSKFVTRMCNIVNDQSNANYSEGKEIIYIVHHLLSVS